MAYSSSDCFTSSISKQRVCTITSCRVCIIVGNWEGDEKGRERNAEMETCHSSTVVLRDIKWWANSCRYTFPPPYETKKKKKMGGTRQLPL